MLKTNDSVLIQIINHKHDHTRIVKQDHTRDQHTRSYKDRQIRPYKGHQIRPYEGHQTKPYKKKKIIYITDVNHTQALFKKAPWNTYSIPSQLGTFLIFQTIRYSIDNQKGNSPPNTDSFNHTKIIYWTTSEITTPTITTPITHLLEYI